MGALDDLIARDSANRQQAEQGALGALLERDALMQREAQANADAPGFIGYQPTERAQEPEQPDPWEQLRKAREQMGGGYEPIERGAEAAVGMLLPGAAPGAGALARAAAGAGQGAGMAGLATARDALQGEDVDLRAAAQRLAMSGATGGALGAASGAIATGARAIGDLANRGYKSAKNLVAGQAVRDAQAQAAMHGVDAIDDNFGGLLDRYSPSSGTGKSAQTHHGVVNAEKERVGQALRDMQQQIQREAVTPDVPGAGSLMPGTPGTIGKARERLVQELERESAASGGTLAKDKQGYAGELARMRDEILGTPATATSTPRTTSRPEPFFADDAAAAAYDQQRALGVGSPPSQTEFRPMFEDDVAAAAFAERQRLGIEAPTGDVPHYDVSRTPARPPLRSFEDFPGLIGEKSRLQHYAHSGPGNSVPETASKEAAAFAGSTLKDEARRIVEGARPELASRYVAENQNFAELATLEEMLRNKAVRDATGGDFGTSLASAVGAGALGAGAGALMSDDPLSGALIGGSSAFAGGLGLTGGATRTAVRQAMGSRGADMGANMLRSIEGGARGLASAAEAFPSGGFAGSEAARGLYGGGDDTPARPGADVAVGPSLVESVLRANPQALGPFAAQLQPLANDPDRLRAKIANLEEREPMFRRILRSLEGDSQPADTGGITFSLEQ